MIEFRLKALSAQGKRIVKSLRDSGLESRCDCGPDEKCLIEITEMPDQRIDVIVTRPGPVAEPGDWKSYTVVEGMYGRRFDKRTPAERICESIEELLDSPPIENGKDECPVVECVVPTNSVPLD